MKGNQIAGGLAGAFIASLGLLWFLQGTGILRMRPILCIANCEEIAGRSPFWAGAGAIVFVIGILAVLASVRRACTPRITRGMKALCAAAAPGRPRNVRSP